MTDEAALDGTTETARASQGRRRVNLIWELTQASIALSVTISTLYVAASLTVQASPAAPTFFLLLSNAFFLVIGFYFGRTNTGRPEWRLYVPPIEGP